MDRILIILKKYGARASSAPALGLNTIIFKYVYWYMKQISGERLQDHWSSCSFERIGEFLYLLMSILSFRFNYMYIIKEIYHQRVAIFEAVTLIIRSTKIKVLRTL